MLDALLILMAVIWGGNYSIIKSALADVPPLAFNALRLTLASALFLVTIAVRQRRAWHRARNLRQQVPGTPDRPGSARHSHLNDAMRLLALAVVGNTSYQLLFIAGLAATSASNSALIIGCTPVFVALMTAAVGHEPISRRRWIGVLLSAAGVYLVVGRGASATTDSLRGDMLILGSVACWSLATIIARPLLLRWPALEVTGISMALGTLLYLPFAIAPFGHIHISDVPPTAWSALAFSGILALYVAYAIWFSAVQRLGGPRTSVYSNLVPVAGLIVASVGFGEHIGLVKAFGAVIVLTGVGLTRL